MNKINFLILLFSLLFIQVAFSQTDKFQSEISAIDKEIATAVAQEDYELASKLKKKKLLYEQLQRALEDENYTKAAELKNEIAVLESGKKNDTQTQGQPAGNKTTEGNYGVYHYDIKYNKSPDNDPFRAQMHNDSYIEPIGISQGLEIGYLLETDETFFWSDLTTYKDHFITITVKNTTGKKIVFNNYSDVLCAVKFTGENVEYDFQGNQVIQKLGGKCPFYAGFLDQENGKYVMHPNEIYEWDYIISQYSDSQLEEILMRRLRPLWVETYSNTPNQKSEFLVYPSINLADFPITTEGNRYYQKVQLPKEKVHVTWAQRNIVMNEQLERSGNYLNVFENDKVKIEVAVDQNGKFDKRMGAYEYKAKIRTTNKMKNKLNINGLIKGMENGEIGRLYFCNAYQLPLKVTNKTIQGYINWKDLEPGQVIEVEESFYMEPYPGEYFVSKKYTPRNVENQRQFIPEYIKIVKPYFFESNDLVSNSDDGQTKVHILMKYAEPSDVANGDRSEWISMFSRYNKNTAYSYNVLFGSNVHNAHRMQVGTHGTFNFQNLNQNEMYVVVADDLQDKYLPKIKEGKTGVKFSGEYKRIEVAKGKELYFYFNFNRQLVQVTKTEFNELVNNSPIEIKKQTFTVN